MLKEKNLMALLSLFSFFFLNFSCPNSPKCLKGKILKAKFTAQNAFLNLNILSLQMQKKKNPKGKCKIIVVSSFVKYIVEFFKKKIKERKKDR